MTIKSWAKVSVQEQCLTGLTTGHIIQVAIYALNQLSVYWTVFPLSRVNKFKKQMVEIGLILIPIIPSDPPIEFVLLSMNLRLLPEDKIRDLWNWKMPLNMATLGSPRQQTRRQREKSL